MARPSPLVAERAAPEWTLLSNHGHVLVCIARDPDVLLREVAMVVGITERATQRIVSELEAEGMLFRERVGRRNRYSINFNAPLRHTNESDTRIGQLLDVFDVPRKRR